MSFGCGNKFTELFDKAAERILSYVHGLTWLAVETSRFKGLFVVMLLDRGERQNLIRPSCKAPSRMRATSKSSAEL
jgi:hypothetical protein